MNRRQTLIELIALGISVAVLLSQYPDLSLAMHRAMLASLQGIARTAGKAALRLEASYKVKVMP
jgi:uncharacterized protein (DUF433 family)